jgi:uncharacterized protein with HEPN domain
VLRALEVMGEAIRNVPPDVLGRAPDIAWRRVVGFRNRLAHGYWSLDEEVVWLAVTRDLPPLRAAAAALLDEADRAGPPPA